MKPWEVAAEDVAAVMRFDRFYGVRLAAKCDAMKINEMTWTQWRVLQELGEAPDGRTAAWLRDKLLVDAGNLSRIIRLFDHHGFVHTYPWPIDRRIQAIDLTDCGRATFRTVERFCREYAGEVLAPLSRGEQRRLVRAMQVIEEILRPRDAFEEFLKHWRR